jgi:hypothetical protein
MWKEDGWDWEQDVKNRKQKRIYKRRGVKADELLWKLRA